MNFTSSIFVAFAALASFAAAAPTSPAEAVRTILAREAANGNLVKRCYIEGPNGCARCVQQYNLSCTFIGGAACSKGASEFLVLSNDNEQTLIKIQQSQLARLQAAGKVDLNRRGSWKLLYVS